MTLVSLVLLLSDHKNLTDRRTNRHTASNHNVTHLWWSKRICVPCKTYNHSHLCNLHTTISSLTEAFDLVEQFSTHSSGRIHSGQPPTGQFHSCPFEIRVTCPSLISFSAAENYKGKIALYKSIWLKPYLILWSAPILYRSRSNKLIVKSIPSHHPM